LSLGERILKTAELCRKLETEREKVLPFYESTVDDATVPEELRGDFEGNQSYFDNLSNHHT